MALRLNQDGFCWIRSTGRYNGMVHRHIYHCSALLSLAFKLVCVA